MSIDTVGVDTPSNQGNTPQTMAAYELRGTPSTILIDRHGRIRKHAFGVQDDMPMGAEIMSLINEPNSDTLTAKPADMNSSKSDGNAHSDHRGCPTR